VDKEQYHDKNKRFRKGNPGGGRPKKLELRDFKPEADEMHQGLIAEACELGEVNDSGKLSPSVKGLLISAKIAWTHILALRSLNKIDSNEQKMLDKWLARYSNSVNQAHNTVKQQIAIRKERGKGGKKPTGMY
jgi:hypothetical protein